MRYVVDCSVALKWSLPEPGTDHAIRVLDQLRLERGIRGITLQQVVKLARVLRVSPDRLLGVGKGNGAQPSSRNERLMRRVRRVEQLSPEQQEAVIKMIDAFLQSRSS